MFDENVVLQDTETLWPQDFNEFVNKSYRLLIIRPRWLNAQSSNQAFSNAKQLVGKNYDFLGTIGFNNPNRYYCSELAVSIYKEWHRPIEKFPDIIKQVIYIFMVMFYMILYPEMKYNKSPFRKSIFIEKF